MIPPSLITAGLVGCGLALVVATAQQKWQLKAFFLLALRLAIGWQFLFEGMYKINSHLAGPMENNKEFSSEMYFKVSPTRLGEMMRRKFNDPAVDIVAYLPDTPDAVKVIVTKELDPGLDDATAAVVADAESTKRIAQKTLETNIAKAANDEEKAKAQKAFDEVKAAVDEQIANAKSIAQKKIEQAKNDYKAWATGAAGRDVKVKHINSDVSLSVPQRKTLIERQKAIIAEAESRLNAGLGNGNGVEVKRLSDLRTELVTMETDLAKDAKAYIAELKKDLGIKESSEPVPEGEGKKLDKVTMWFIAVVGACILFGLFTRLSCVLAAGFLLVTYLTHPPFPWYTLPPATEGNPLFVNKNLIEMFALLVLACYPTGKWLGLDALVGLIFGCRKDCDLQPNA